MNDMTTPGLQKPWPRPRITLDDITQRQQHTSEVMDRMKTAAFRPMGQKEAPIYNASQLALLCGVSASTMARHLERAAEDGMPAGVQAMGKNEKAKRVFPLDHTRAWVQRLSTTFHKRSADQKAATIAVTNFKGGVGKTTVAVNLAQGLSLKGYKVLMIDLDPQGSATSLLGYTPLSVEVQNTFLPLASGERETIKESILSTYWDGLDLVPGNTGLFNAEFYLPARVIEAQREDSVFNFEEVLNIGLADVRAEYDYIIIDNPPAFGYSTLNAIWAADAILMPVEPEGLSVMSSSQFWTLFDELAGGVVALGGRPKDFAWIGILPSMMVNKPSYQMMLQYVRSAYEELLLRSEIPNTAVVTQGGMKLKTVYDFSKYVGSQKTYEKARVAFDELVYEIDELTRETVWGVVPTLEEMSK